MMQLAASNMNDSPISPIEDILEDARNGRPYILVDAEDRENEGDVIIPAQFATPDQINFMSRHARGLICLAITTERARQLRLPRRIEIRAYRRGGGEARSAREQQLEPLLLVASTRSLLRGIFRPGAGRFDHDVARPGREALRDRAQVGR